MTTAQSIVKVDAEAFTDFRFGIVRMAIDREWKARRLFRTGKKNTVVVQQ